MDMPIIEVHGCDDCPFLDGAFDSCAHPEIVMAGDVGDLSEQDEAAPEWCPLRSGGVAVVLGEEAGHD